jgi:NAD(P)-dependent dehydrogenase (short-subunit alcohol dehydrogenase family)
MLRLSDQERRSMASQHPNGDAARTAAAQRDIQASIDAQDVKAGGRTAGGKKPVQAGLKAEPSNPMPRQHLKKPGNEHELQVEPRFLAEGYVGSGKLQDMVAIVTGGDSGIGRAVAVLFAREGADVAVLYLDEHEDAKATKQHVESEGRRCLTVAGDVRDAEFCERAVTQVAKEFGRLDILVNNAAFQQHAKTLEDITDEHLMMTLETNIGGYFHMARAVLPHMHEGACIINTSSETALFGNKELLDYSATKGAINAFTMSLASNLLDRGIRVNAVAPGPVWTPLNPADKDAESVAKFGQDSDMRRPAQPEELSPAYVFLAAPSCASYITGIVLPVTGSVGGI